MFSKPLSQVTYSDAEAFFSVFKEGVRVEYKREMIKDIPKVISAFANTLGGIIVIGVETDAQNKVITINGIENQSGIEESIVNSSLQGIYPSVIPEIKILDIPTKENKVIIIIKVHESVDAPHAIQNSTRVYIRTGSVSQPYELEKIDRIEYLLKRRDNSVKIKEKLIQAAHNRYSGFLDNEKTKAPTLFISISPMYPYQPLISLDELFVSYNSFGEEDNHQRITDGICVLKKGRYKEINQYGLVFRADILDKIKGKWETDERLFIKFASIISKITKTLELCEKFYSKCGYLGNLEIKICMENISNEYLLYNTSEVYPEYKAIDKNTSLSKIIVTEDIKANLLDVMVSLAKNILWIFNCPDTNLAQRIENVLAVNGLTK